MEEETAIRRYEEAARVLPGRLRGLALSQPQEVRRLAEEFRLRAGRPLAVLLPEGERSLGDAVTTEDLEDLCDLATDYALEKAVKWGARVILSVPCCQHELNRQMKNDVLEPIFRYGLLKERCAALFTDGIRAQVLEYLGYRTQILEFIDMEHTPKNILLRAVKNGEINEKVDIEINEFEKFLDIHPTLGELLKVKEENDK